MKRAQMHIALILAIIACVSLIGKENNCLAPVNVNSANLDEFPFNMISADGKDMFYFVVHPKDTDTESNFKGSAFYVMKKTGHNPVNSWGMPRPVRWNSSDRAELKKLNINSIAASDSLIALSVQETSGGNGAGMPLYLYQCKISEGQIGKKEPISGLNTPGFNSIDPCFSLDGNRLYFASDRPGGMGKYDIYYSDKIGGSWSAPKPLDAVNTSGSERSPHCGVDGRFYFSGNWSYKNDSYGNAGMDIQVSEFSPEGDVLPPQNLGLYIEKMVDCKPACQSYNSPYDELFPVITTDSAYIVFSSNKSGGSFDIYSNKINSKAVKIKLNITEQFVSFNGSIMGTSGLKGDFAILVSTEGGSYHKYRSRDTFEIYPGENYKISLLHGKDTCALDNYGGNALFSIISKTPQNCDSLIVKDIVVKSSAKADSIEFGPENFIRGYWKPVTYDNFSEFKERIESGYFNKSPFVNIGYDDLNAVYKVDDKLSGLYLKLDRLVKDYYECIYSSGYKLKISFVGYSDESHLNTGMYPGKTVKIQNEVIPSNTPFRDAHNGNIMLSKLRANFLETSIKNMMNARSSIFRMLENKGRIEFESHGLGKSGSKLSRSSAVSANGIVNVFIDLGPESWITNINRGRQSLITMNESQSPAKTIADNTPKNVKPKQEKIVKKTELVKTPEKKPKKEIVKRDLPREVTQKIEEKKKAVKKKESLDKAIPKKPEISKTVVTDKKPDKSIDKNKLIKKEPGLVQGENEETSQAKEISKSQKDKSSKSSLAAKEMNPEKSKNTPVVKTVVKKMPEKASAESKVEKKKAIAETRSLQKIEKNTELEKDESKPALAGEIEKKKSSPGNNEKAKEVKISKLERIAPVSEKIEKATKKPGKAPEKIIKKQGNKPAIPKNKKLQEYSHLIENYTEKGLYTINFGAYMRESNCANLIAFLDGNGVKNLRIAPVYVRGRKFYRVRSDYFNDYESAKNQARIYRRIVRAARIKAPVVITKE